MTFAVKIMLVREIVLNKNNNKNNASGAVTFYKLIQFLVRGAQIQKSNLPLSSLSRLVLFLPSMHITGPLANEIVI